MANLCRNQLDLSNAEAYRHRGGTACDTPRPDLTKAEIQERLTALENTVSAMDVERIYDDLLDAEVSELDEASLLR